MMIWNSAQTVGVVDLDQLDQPNPLTRPRSAPKRRSLWSEMCLSYRCCRLLKGSRRALQTSNITVSLLSSSLNKTKVFPL